MLFNLISEQILSIIFLWNFQLKNIIELKIIIWGNIPIGKRTRVKTWKNITNRNAITLVLLIMSKKGIETIGPSIINFAKFEGLEAHAKSVEKRIRRK